MPLLLCFHLAHHAEGRLLSLRLMQLSIGKCAAILGGAALILICSCENITWAKCPRCKRNMSILSTGMKKARRRSPKHRHRLRLRLRPNRLRRHQRRLNSSPRSPVRQIRTWPNAIPDYAAEDRHHAAWRAVHRRERSGRTIFLLRDEFRPDHFHDHLSCKQGGSSGCNGPGKSRSVVSHFRYLALLLPILGAVLADAIFGKFWVVFWLSIVYCGGHLTLALMGTGVAHAIEPRYLLAIGLS